MKYCKYDVDRLTNQLNKLEETVYRNRIEIDEFSICEDSGEIVNPSIPSKDKFISKMMINDFWSGRDKYLWIHFDFKVPESFSNKKIVGLFDFGKTGGGNNSAFESLLYVDDKIYQAVDSNHKEVFFSDLKSGQIVSLTFRLWSGLEGGGEKIIQYHQLKTAFISIFEETVDKYKYLLKNSLETINVLDENNLIKYRLYKAVLLSYDEIDWSIPESIQYYKSVERAYSLLEKMLSEIPRNNDVKVGCVGHTHIDLAWLWRYKHTREKGVRSFSTVDRFMESYEDYQFMHTSPQLYQAIKEDSPELFNKIKNRVKENKWEPSGAMWVEADCNIPSGESLVRQVYYGKKFFREEFNSESDYLWLPDVFGYSWALPQILTKAGVKTFVTTKISWNDTNRLPHDTFIWKGIDGSSILTHFITTPEKGQRFSTYNGDTSPFCVQGVWDNYNDKLLNDDLLICYGYGDGGGGPSRAMIENIEAVKKIPGLPEVRNTNVKDYLDKLHKTIKENEDYLATWKNELYFEFHRGTYTSQAKTKKNNRKLENLYRETEILCSLASLSDSFNYPLEQLEMGWKLILLNQFHDIIPGSSIEEVYADTAIDSEKAFSIALKHKKEALDSLITKATSSFSVINNTGRERKSLVQIGSQYLYTQIEPFTTKKISLPLKKGEPVISYMDGRIDSPFYSIELNEMGQLASVFDKKAGREVLTSIGNVFEIFEDRPREYDAWEIDESFERKMQVIDKLISSKVLVNNDCFLKLEQVWSYNKSVITQEMIVYKDIKRIDFKTKVDWNESSKLLKVLFPVDVFSLTARYEIQHGSIERPTHQSTSWDTARYEVLAHSWADLSEAGFGVSLINDCKYGYDIKDNSMRLSLLKSAEYPDCRADKGIQEFTYALYSHSERWNESELLELSFDLNNPLEVIEGEFKINPAKQLDFSKCDVSIDAFKLCDNKDGYILRMHEDKGKRNNISLTLGSSFKCWAKSSLMEEPLEDFNYSKDINLQLKPFELLTLIIK
jgi:alpha-mannosidase